MAISGMPEQSEYDIFRHEFQRGRDPELYWLNKYKNDDEDNPLRMPQLRTDIRSLYKHEDRYYLIAGLMSAQESIIYDMRRAGVEYSEMLTVNAPEAMFIQEHGEKVLAEDAIIHLADLAR